MCIIIFKPEDAEILKKKMYKRCFRNNPHGAGYAWWDEEGDTWHVRKGFMTFKEWWKSFNKMHFTAEDCFIIHFRVGTSGHRKGPDCTHPFPVTEDYEEMRKLEFSSKNIVFHNGVINYGRADISDSMLGVGEYIAPLFPYMNTKSIENILEELLMVEKCRWLITEGREATLFGKWIEDKNYKGIYFSNSGYLPPEPKICHTAQRFYRIGSIDEFLLPSGEWSWELWNREPWEKIYDEENKDKNDTRNWNIPDNQRPLPLLTGPDQTPLITPNLPLYKDHKKMIIGMVDNNGDIVALNYLNEDEAISCAECGGVELADSTIEEGEVVCLDCGCIFNPITEEIIASGDTGFDTAYCEVCNQQMLTDLWGQCPVCETILNPDKIAAKIVAQQKGGV